MADDSKVRKLHDDEAEERDQAAIEEARAKVADPEPEPDGQYALEIPEGGRKINLGTVIPRGTPVDLKYKMSGRSVPNVKGGMMDPADTTGLLLASRVVEEYQIKFTRDADLNIEKATVYVIVGTRNVVNARSEAGELLLRGEEAAA